MGSDFNLISKTLSGHYVFYERLQETHNDLYNQVSFKMDEAAQEAKRARINTDFIYAQANAEREKELNLIERMTGHRPAPGDWGANAQNIIDAINLCINSKDIYQRIYQTIMANGTTQGKGMFSFFGGYLQTTINEEWPAFMKTKSADKISEITEADFLQWLQKTVLPKAIQRMFDAEPEDGVDPELKNAYQELAKLVGTFDAAGSFAAQLADIYDLDQVAAEIKNIVDKRTTKKKPGSIPSLTKNVKLTYARSGLTLEAMVDLMFEAVLPKDGKSGHGNIGSLQARADNLFTIGIDYSAIQSFLSEQETGSRESNVKAFMALGEHLKQFQDGFIIYSSDKNYSLTDDFERRGGFSSGTDLTLMQYQSLMETAGRNVNTFIGAIEQLANGAVGQDQSKTDYADIISKNIAYLLFDDFNTIGAGLTNGPQAIHIMNLNGLFVPISSILYALGDALQADQSIKNIVRTSIKLPSIKFKEDEDQRSFENANPGVSAWAVQREEMLSQGRISVHFLGSLKQMLASRALR